MSVESTLDGILKATGEVNTASSEDEIWTATARGLAASGDSVAVRIYRRTDEGLGLVTESPPETDRGVDEHSGVNEHVREGYRQQRSVRCCVYSSQGSDIVPTNRSSLSVPVGFRGVIEILRQPGSDFDEAEIGFLELFAAFVERRITEETRCSVCDPSQRGPFVDGTDSEENEGRDTIGIGEIQSDGTIEEWRGGRGDGHFEPDCDARISSLPIIPGYQEPTVRQAVSAVFETGSPRVLEISVPPGHERLTDIRLTIAPNSVSDDQPHRAIAIIKDISERKTRERDLEFFKTFLDRSNDGFYIIESESSVIVDVNETATDMLGYERQELIGMTIPEIDPEFSNESWGSFVKRLREKGRVVIETTHRRKDGSAYPAEIELAYVEFDRPYHVATVRDISSRRERQRQLEEARKRYRTLFHMAPDPIFVVDVESSEVVEVNAAGSEIRGQSCSEIIGQTISALHPPEKSHAYGRMFEQCCSEGSGRIRHLPDGSLMELQSASGENIPIEISYQVVEFDDTRLIYGIFRDISEQVDHERSLAAVNDGARVLFEAEHPSVVATRLVEIVTVMLDFEVASVHLADEDEGVLRPVAYEPEYRCEEMFEQIPVFGPGEGLAWEVFETQEARVIDDMKRVQNVYNPSTPIRSEIIHPLGEHGVLIVGDSTVDAFGQRDVDLLEILAATGDIALDRTQREQRIQSQRYELETRTEQLEELESINARTRNIMKAVVNSHTRPEIEQTVCAELVQTDSVSFAWIGEPNPIEDRLSVLASAGTDRGYLDRADFDTDSSEPVEPAVRALQSGDPVSVQNTARQMGSSEWRRQALRADYRSIFSIPLRYHNTHLGVLTVYGDETYAFTGVIRSVLIEIGNLLANAFAAIERKSALLSNQVTELEFIIRDPACFFLRYAQQTGAEIELDRIIPQEDHSSLVFVRIENDPPEDLLVAAEEGSSTREPKLVESADGTLVQIRFVEPFIATQLADHGISVRNISADDSACRVHLAVPPTTRPRAVIDIVTGLFPQSELVAKRERQLRQDVDEPDLPNPLSKLTPRQREVLAFAHARGFFESSRMRSGSELSEELELSSSAFHRHIRAAEEELVGWIFEQYDLADMVQFADQNSSMD